MIGISLFVSITWFSLAPLISGWLSSHISLTGSNTHINEIRSIKMKKEKNKISAKYFKIFVTLDAFKAKGDNKLGCRWKPG